MRDALIWAYNNAGMAFANTADSIAAAEAGFRSGYLAAIDEMENKLEALSREKSMEDISDEIE